MNCVQSLILSTVVVLGTVSLVSNKEPLKPTPTCRILHQMEITSAYSRSSKEDKARLALAITATTSSKKERALLMALAKVESNFDFRAIGDSGNAQGAFQVWSRYWGRVSLENPSEQARQALNVISKCGFNPRIYNGGYKVTKQSLLYAKKVREWEAYYYANI